MSWAGSEEVTLPIYMPLDMGWNRMSEYMHLLVI